MSKKFLFIYNPKFKVIVNILFTIILGLLCNALINELTSSNQVNWWKIIYHFEFWAINVVSSLYIFILIITAKEEIKLRSKLDNEYCRQFIQQEGIKSIVEKQIEAIKKGRYDEFDELSTIFEKVKKNI